MMHNYKNEELGNEIVEYIKEYNGELTCKITRNDYINGYFFIARINKGSRAKFHLYLGGMVLKGKEISLRLSDEGYVDLHLDKNIYINCKHLKTVDMIGFEVAY